MELKTYSLDVYAKELNKLNLLKSSADDVSEALLIHEIEYNSRDVAVEGTLFICKGAQFKKEYLESALEAGAVAYVSETKYDLDREVPAIIVTNIDEAMSTIADVFFNCPQKQLKLIGVGGTKGKTTTVYYIKSILDQYLQASGKKPAGLISSIDVYDGESTAAAVNTTPIAVDLKRHFSTMAAAGLEYVVMEVSSQALKYHRTLGLEFEVGTFLNIDEDHISPIEHPDFNDYLDSKIRMFEQTKHLVINLDTQEADYIFKRVHDAEEVHTFSLQNKEADYYVSEVETVGLTNHFTVQTKESKESYILGMAGVFNVENAVAAIATGDLLGVSPEYAREALKDIKVPGRMELSMTEDKQIIAIADFAHNRLSFLRLVESMKNSFPAYRIVTIFGAPGGKSLDRREKLGEVSGELSDEVIITMDDPGFEEVMDISLEIAEYVKPTGTPYRIIEDREEAIQLAFQEAEGPTVILALGKGDEDIMRIKGKAVPMRSDKAVIQECIQKYNANN